MTGGGLNIVYAGPLPPHPGGSAISAWLVLLGVAQLGHSVRAVAPITAEAQTSGDRYAAKHPGIRINRFPVLSFNVRVDVPPLAQYYQMESEGTRHGLQRLIDEERPDLVLLGREMFALHGVELAQANGVPCVVRLAGSGVRGIVRRLFPESLRQDYLRLLRQANGLISPAQHLAADLRPFGIDSVRVIPNAVDLKQFMPRPKSPALLEQFGIAGDDIVVMHASNMKPVKRPHDLIAAAPGALAQNPRLLFVMLGDGSLRAEMEEACRAANVVERFRFTGWRDYDEVPDYLSLADMMVMPSDHEGVARVYLETMASARLLLASDIPGVREAVEDGQTAVLFRLGDIADLAEKIVWAAARPEKRQAIGQRARGRMQRHSLDVVARAYAAAFQEIVGAA